MATGSLAFIPFYDPMPALYPWMSDYWLWLVVPLVIAISVVYKCTRIESLKGLAREATIMSVQIMVVMVLAAVVLAAGHWGYLRISGTIAQ